MTYHNTEVSEELAKTNTAKISRLLSEAYDLINQCEALADEANLKFSFDIVRGMGGTYVGDHAMKRTYDNVGWNPSSESC